MLGQDIDMPTLMMRKYGKWIVALVVYATYIFLFATTKGDYGQAIQLWFISELVGFWSEIIYFVFISRHLKLTIEQANEKFQDLKNKAYELKSKASPGGKKKSFKLKDESFEENHGYTAALNETNDSRENSIS